MKSTLIILSLLLSVNFTVAQSVDFKKGLVAHFSFDNNANDEIASNHGKVTGAILTQDRFGNENNAYSFDGLDDKIEVGSISLPKDNFSYVIWVKPNKVSGEYCDDIISKHNDPDNIEILMRVHSQLGYIGETNIGGKFVRIESDALNKKQKNNIPSFDKFDQLIMQYDGEKLQYYVNAKLIQEINASGRIKETPYKFTIGMPYFGRTIFEGIIDDIKIYNRALSRCEIAHLFHFNPLSPKQRISQYLEREISMWEKRGEYETTNEYETRILDGKDDKIKQLRNFSITEISQEIAWHCGSKKYDADNSHFTLKFNNVEEFNLQVPRSEAREFGDNFDKLEYSNAKFKISDKPNLVVDCITIKNPVNGKEYKYGCSSSEIIPDPESPRFTNSKVTVKIWDEQQEDGDIVSVFLNDARIKKEISVKKAEHIFTLELEKGVNVIKLLAHNEGKNPPNTAAILIDDGDKEYKTVLSSKKGEFAELKIVLE